MDYWVFVINNLSILEWRSEDRRSRLTTSTIITTFLSKLYTLIDYIPWPLKKSWMIYACSGKVEEVVEEVEEVAEVVEKVATAAENVIGAVADKLPANTILKEAAEAVEHATAQLAEDAHNVTIFIHKVYSLYYYSLYSLYIVYIIRIIISKTI